MMTDAEIELQNRWSEEAHERKVAVIRSIAAMIYVGMAWGAFLWWAVR